MKKETSLCMGCMEETRDAEACAVCGYAKNSVFLASYLAPTTFLAGRYIIGKLISYNGEGALYMAFDTVSNIKVTVREYMPDTLCGRKKEQEAIEVNSQYVALYKTYLSEFIDLNRSLMNIGQSLRIQRVLDVFTENNTAYAVCEYITGISLKTYLSSLGGVLPWEEVRELFTPLFTTLNLLHSEGIIHRGICPSAILLSDKKELVLINFGITAGRTYGSELNFEVFAGYAGPEQYSNSSRHGSWTDVYGISAVLYKVLTGQLPPDAIARKEHDSLTEPMLVNRNIPQGVSTAIMKGLTLDVDERTQAVNELITELFGNVIMSVPENTNEIFIRKPVRAADDEEKKPVRKTPQRPRKNEKKSYIVPIALFSALGVLVLAFVTVIIISAVNPDFFNENKLGNGTNGNSANGDPNGGANNNPGDNGNNGNNGNNGGNGNQQQQPNNDPLNVIPDLAGRNFETVQKSPLASRVEFVAEFIYTDEVPEGQIFEQSVEANSEVPNGTEIKIKVSQGPERIALPAFNNKKFSDYQKELSAAKIKYNSQSEHHETIPEGNVIRCSIDTKNINAGGMVNITKDKSETVTVYYSRGPERFVLPAYNGVRIEEFEFELTRRGINYESIGEYNPNVPVSTIIRCRVKGDYIPAGTLIDVDGGDVVIVHYSLG